MAWPSWILLAIIIAVLPELPRFKRHGLLGQYTVHKEPFTVPLAPLLKGMVFLDNIHKKMCAVPRAP